MRELATLPLETQSWIKSIAFQELESKNLSDLGYLEKMSGYTNKFKIRVCDYRIGITVDKQTRILICQRVAHRKDIYRYFP